MVIDQIRRPDSAKHQHPAAPATDIVVQHLDVDHLILDPMMVTGHQVFMNNPCARHRHLDITLVAIAAQDDTARQQGQQRWLELPVALVQQHPQSSCARQTRPPLVKGDGVHLSDVLRLICIRGKKL